MKKIAITGGIGSGKSEVSNHIKALGYPVFSCDQINAELLKKRRVLKRIKALFPNTVKGFLRLKLDKKTVAIKVFSDKKAIGELNSLLHPLIMNDLLKKMQGVKSDLVFAEVPLLFEEGYQTLFDDVIVVKRKKEDRINAVIKRSGLTKEEVLYRINNQIDYDKFDFSSYKVINNEKNFLELKTSTEIILKLILGE